MARKAAPEGNGTMAGNDGKSLWDTLHIELEVPIAAPPERVFEALTRDIAAWWGDPYLHGNATNVVLEPVVGGRLYEVWGENMGSLWATVTRIQVPKELCLVGSIGLPQPSHAVTTFQLVPKGEETVVQFTHEAFGHLGHKQCDYVAGWKDLLETRLTAFVEQGFRSAFGSQPETHLPDGNSADS